MKTIVLQHEPETPPGSTIPWLQSKNQDFIVVNAQLGDFPELNQFNNVIVCGGSFNTDQQDIYSWLKLEKKFLRLCVEENKKILGLCLGGQLLAEALGGEVRPMGTTHNRKWEIGWHPVQLDKEFRYIHKDSLVGFHWHEHEFSLPPYAERFASSQKCPNQAFRYKDHIVGFQFHPEVDEEWIELALADFDQPSSEGIQSREQMRELNSTYLAQTKSWYFKFLDDFFLNP